MLPAFLRSSRALPALGAVSVGLSLAACTGLAFGLTFEGFNTMVLLTALPTLVLGTTWAALLRWHRTAERRQLRLGWLLSVPLGACSGAITGGLLGSGLAGLGGGEEGLDAFLGLAIGLFVWMPALLLMLLVFGAPIAWSQQQARRGLLDAERGELAVGLVCSTLSVVALLSLAVTGRFSLPQGGALAGPGSGAMAGAMAGAMSPYLVPGTVFLTVLASLGLLSGALVAGLAGWRGRRRRQLVEAAEAGERTDYRVEQTTAGRVLIRVQRAADDYRQADLDEAFFALEEEPAAAARPGLTAARGLADANAR